MYQKFGDEFWDIDLFWILTPVKISNFSFALVQGLINFRIWKRLNNTFCSTSLVFLHLLFQPSFSWRQKWRLVSFITFISRGYFSSSSSNFSILFKSLELGQWDDITVGWSMPHSCLRSGIVIIKSGGVLKNKEYVLLRATNYRTRANKGRAN